MDYQILNNNFKLNINKNIGKVLYVVEGEKREINILRIIFRDILKYEEIISINRKGKETHTYFNPENQNSKIAIINSKESNIATIEDTNFIDEQVKNIKQYDLDFNYEDAAIFYIFDCDRIEDQNKIGGLIKKFSNSREPSLDYKFDSIGGMLLLNFPAIETFIISNFEQEMYKFNERFDFEKQTLKEYINQKKYNDNHLCIETLTNAFYEMIKSLNEIKITSINLDNVSEFNTKVLNYEDSMNKKYMLSLLLISFIDLGIIEMN